MGDDDSGAEIHGEGNGDDGGDSDGDYDECDGAENDVIPVSMTMLIAMSTRALFRQDRLLKS